MVKAEVKGKQLVITLDLETPKDSGSGKNTVVASSHGNQTTTAEFQGKPIVVGVNAYVRK